MDTDALYKSFLKSSGITTDSRQVGENNLFIGLRGDRFDGNKYAGEALKAGASLAVVDDPAVAGGKGYCLVENSLSSLQDLAAHHRRQLDIPLIAITGSNGKTTTKELMRRVLSEKYPVHANRGNLNNHIGVPLTLLEMDAGTEMGIVEMGANHRGEISRLCEISKPDYGLITNIGKAHLEGFGSLEGVMLAKKELYDHLGRVGGLAFCNRKNEQLKQMLEGYSGGIEYYGSAGTLCSGELSGESPELKVRIRLSSGEEMEIQTGMTGDYNLENILAAVAVGLHFRIPVGGIRQAIESYRPENNRSQQIESDLNILIMDAYNANPTSMVAALENFRSLHHTQKTLILGEMNELGIESASEHKALLDRLERDAYREVFLVGGAFRDLRVPESFRVFNDVDELLGWLDEHPLRDRMILLKGSRKVGLERLLDNL